MTTVKSTWKQWAAIGVTSPDGYALVRPAAVILDDTGAITTTSAARVDLVDGVLSRDTDPTPVGAAEEWSFKVDGFPAGPYWFQIPDVPTVSIVDLLQNHQVDPKTLDPLPSAPTVGAAIATAQAIAQGAQETADQASSDAAAAQTTANAALPATGLDAATAALVPDSGTATGAALSAAIVAGVTSQVATPGTDAYVAVLDAATVAVSTDRSKPLHVGDVNGMFCGTTQSDGVSTDSNCEVEHILNGAVAQVRLVYVNETASLAAPNAITVRAGLQNLSGSFTPVFFNGVRDVVIAPNGVAISDPVNAAFLDGRFRSRTKVSVTSAGMKWPVTYITQATRGDWVVVGTAGDDFTTSGAQTSSTGNAFGPIAALAITDRSDRDVVALIGDSITAGTGATAPTWMNSFSRLAATAKGKISVNVGYAGSMSSAGSGLGFRQRTASTQGATHSIELYGTNDFATSALAQIQARLIANWRERALRGVRVYACTLPPRATSTDSFATLANQADATGNTTVRVQLNDWIRAGAPVNSSLVAVAIGTAGALTMGQPGHPLIGMFETADAVESSRNSGKWKVDGSAFKWTGEGVHPTAIGHQAMADAIVAQWPTVF